jgi:hypothetical protein
MTAPRRPTPATAERYVKAVQRAGVTVAELRVEPDGTIRIIAATGAATPADAALETWMRSNGAG